MSFLSNRFGPRTQVTISWIVVIGVSACFTALLAVIGGASDRFPRWDEARHGLDAVRLADAIRQVQPLAFIHDLWSMAYWPPTYPLLELPVVLVFGSDYSVPRCFMSFVFGAMLIATFGAGLALGGRRGVWTGLLATALVSASPFLQHYGTVIMLELPGALLTLVSFLTYARYRATQRSRDLRFACASALALFFCKYNFGILWMIAVLLFEVWEASAWRRLAPRTLELILAPLPRARAFRIFLCIYVGFLFAILLTGGWTWQIAGQRISVHKLGNPVSILAGILLIRFFTKPSHNTARIRAWFQSLAPRFRAYVGLVLAPIVIWLLLPPHTSAFFNFVQNRPASRSLAEDLLWYPRDFIQLYSPSPELGVLVLVVGLLPIFWIHRQTASDRILTLAVMVAFAAPVMHPLKEARFLLVLTPLLWLSFARVVAGTLERVLARSANTRHQFGVSRSDGGNVAVPRVVALSVTLLLTGLLVLQPFRFEARRTQAAFDRFTLAPGLQPVLDAVRDASVTSEGVVLLGLWDWFSPYLVEWHLRISHPGLTEHRIPRGPNRRARLGDPARFVDQLAEKELTTILVLDLEGEPPFAAAYRKESGWLPPVAARLEQDPRFRLERHTRFPEAGYSLREYRKE